MNAQKAQKAERSMKEKSAEDRKYEAEFAKALHWLTAHSEGYTEYLNKRLNPKGGIHGQSQPPLVTGVTMRPDQLDGLHWLRTLWENGVNAILGDETGKKVQAIAMIAFLRKAERTEVLPFVHGGWLSALGAGALTWVAATYLIGVSGAGRELVEGFGSLFAVLVLLSVGIWMHGKSQAGEWQRYIRKTMQHALSRRSAWFLFGLAFLVVYREVFETILFFAALWSQGHTDAILAGAAAAIVLLALIAWAMLRYSRRLPIGTFFAYSSVLIGILAVVLAGKGISGLQEAGLLGITPLPNLPRIPILGIAPALEPVAAQILTLALIALGYWRNRMKGMQSGTPQAETG